MSDEPRQLLAVTSPDLTDQIDISPDLDVESWRLSVPAKGACYVLEDSESRPVLLATCGDLRAALVRRLGPQPAEGPSKRIDYRSVVRRVRWRAVFSRFEANWSYLENARTLLPTACRGMVEHWGVHWVSVGVDDAHPRFVAADRPVSDPRTCFGPIPDARSARKLVETLEDLFDLCRYHHILAQAPHGTACAYKQMGRCPAPCDGTITLEAYRDQVCRAVAFLTEPRGAWVERLTEQMRAAAGERRFEDAARYKGQLERARTVDARVAPLSEMRWVVIQPGEGKGAVRVFMIAPGTIAYAGQIGPTQRESLLPLYAERVAAWREDPVASMRGAAAERAALVAWHLLNAQRDRGVYLHADKATAQALREVVEKVATSS